MDHHSHRADSFAGLSLKSSEALREQTVCCGTLLSTSQALSIGLGLFGSETLDENLNMDYTWLLLLNLSGAICAVVQWTELEEAKVR